MDIKTKFYKDVKNPCEKSLYDCYYLRNNNGDGDKKKIPVKDGRWA